jgi:tetratricopeptide (TPR) repeat protein
MRAQAGVAVLSLLAAARAVAADDQQDALLRANAAASDAAEAADWDLARRELYEALAIAQRAALPPGPELARTYLLLGVVYVTAGRDERRALRSFGRALEIAPDIEVPAGLENIVVRQLFARERQQHPPSAAAIEVVRRANDEAIKAYAAGSLDFAKQRLSDAIREVRDTGPTKELARTYLIIGVIYQKEGRPASWVLPAFNKALEIDPRIELGDPALANDDAIASLAEARRRRAAAPPKPTAPDGPGGFDDVECLTCAVCRQSGDMDEDGRRTSGPLTDRASAACAEVKARGIDCEPCEPPEPPAPLPGFGYSPPCMHNTIYGPTPLEWTTWLGAGGGAVHRAGEARRAAFAARAGAELTFGATGPFEDHYRWRGGPWLGAETDLDGVLGEGGLELLFSDTSSGLAASLRGGGGYGRDRGGHGPLLSATLTLGVIDVPSRQQASRGCSAEEQLERPVLGHVDAIRLFATARTAARGNDTAVIAGLEFDPVMLVPSENGGRFIGPHVWTLWIGGGGGVRDLGSGPRSFAAGRAGLSLVVADGGFSRFYGMIDSLWGEAELQTGGGVLGEGGLELGAIPTQGTHPSYAVRLGGGYGPAAGRHRGLLSATLLAGTRFVPESCAPLTLARGARLFVTVRAPVDGTAAVALLGGVEVEPTMLLPPYSAREWIPHDGGDGGCTVDE